MDWLLALAVGRASSSDLPQQDAIFEGCAINAECREPLVWALIGCDTAFADFHALVCASVSRNAKQSSCKRGWTSRGEGLLWKGVSGRAESSL